MVDYYLNLRMQRRSPAVKRSKVLHSGEMFSSMKEFSSGQLATKRQVIERTMYEDSYLQRSASAIVAKELMDMWIRSNVYPVHEITVTNRVFEIIPQFSKLDRWPKKKQYDNFTTKENSFTCKLDELFDIYCLDGTQRHALEKQHGLRMAKNCNCNTIAIHRISFHIRDCEQYERELRQVQGRRTFEVELILFKIESAVLSLSVLRAFLGADLTNFNDVV